MNSWIHRINRAIAFCFYLIFFLVPLIMFPTTFELFEFNKMWTVYGITLIILFLWISKIILQGRISITQTPLDIPIFLFLASQIISTIFSLDPHVSFWGYYSRFNGGLLSILTYIFLYYAFASNLIGKEENGMGLAARMGNGKRHTSYDTSRHNDTQASKQFSYKILLASLISGAIVAIWGFPSHFGYDPTCLVFRGSLDVSCWTEAFQPKVRIFSTLGQPNWLAAYLAILIPITIAMAIKFFNPNIETGKKNHESRIMNYGIKNFFLTSLFLLLTSLFYVDLLWTSSQSGFLGFWVGNIVFLVLFFMYRLRTKNISFSSLLTPKPVRFLIFLNITFLLINFLIGFPIQKLNQFKFSNLINSISQSKQEKTIEKKIEEKKFLGPLLETGGTDSGKIRRIVWAGAIEIFKQNPLIGSGVETFAYAYYKVKPVEHNLTSEWDYLYNKAHNEYLNYLATTGIFGLGSYLLIIGMFLFHSLKIITNFKYQINTNIKLKNDNIGNLKLEIRNLTLSIALIASYISILVSNFFGFSVVIINLYFFFIPLLFYSIALPESLKYQVLSFTSTKNTTRASSTATTIIIVVALIILFLELVLFQFWRADIKYALGYNLDKAGDYVQANKYLTEAAKARSGEYLYKDELAVNLATLTLALIQENNSTEAAYFAKQAKDLSDEVILHHPNNITYYKSRTRVLYSLAQLEPSLTNEAIGALQKGQELAPNDVKVLYNLGLLYEQAGDSNNTIKYLRQTIEVKPDYRDAYYALALHYSNIAEKDPSAYSGQANPNKSKEYINEARKLLEYTLKNIEPNDPQAKELLNSIQ